jgi:hypothetical protein
MALQVEGSYGAVGRHGIERLRRALAAARADGAEVLAGTPAGSPRVAALQRAGTLRLASTPESLAIAREGQTLVIAGSDERGLMYAALEAAEQVEAGSGPAAIGECAESPQTSFRGLYIFLHNADCEREWFYSREHWESYFDLLAASRYNSFSIVMAHQTSYLAPPFPFFVDVPEHPEVTVPGLSLEQRSRNLEALNMIAALAAAHGLDFVVGIWEVIAWKRETGHGTHTQTSTVAGLDWDNLESYTYHAARRLLAACPGIGGIQLRVNAESGVPPARQTAFFTNTIFRAIREAGRPVLLDLRGWIAHPQTIEAAMGLGIPMRLSMKYWAEHLGAPYQAAEQNPAYSYADFLRYPRRCPISYQVWALGSHRHFVWGDPEYARTFCRSLRLGDGIGFEICPQLAQKGYGNEPGAWRVLHPQHEYYRWEWERYWLYHLLFGRLTYNGDAGEQTWMRPMRARFGSAAPAVMAALRTASRVVSFIIRFNMSDPNMYIWPEADTGGLLDFYIAVPPSDPAVIKSFAEEAAERMSGRPTARMSPAEAAAYLRSLGEQCLAGVAALRSSTGAAGRNKELASTLVDIEALGELALFHAEKIPAAEALALYYASGDASQLARAVAQLPRARPHWERLAAVTSGVYTERQVTGPIDSGHWRHKLGLVREDEQRLAVIAEIGRRFGGHTRAFDFGGRPEIGPNYSRIRSMHDYHVEKGFIGVDGSMGWGWGRPYGWESDGGIESVAAPLVRFCDWHTDTVFRDSMERPGWEKLAPYADQLTTDYVAGRSVATFHCTLPAGAYEVIVLLADRSASPRRHGPFTIKVNGQVMARDVVVGPGEERELRQFFELGRAKLELAFEPGGAGDWFVSALVARPLAPAIAHAPVRTAEAGRPLRIACSVACPEPLGSVRLAARPDGGAVRSVEMRPGAGPAVFEAELAGELLAAGSRVSYWIEATSASGRTARLAPLPLLAVDPARASSPAITHEPVTRARPGEPVTIRVGVAAALPLRAVLLHYRYTNQYYEYRVVEMERDGDGWAAEIPSDYVVSDWDLMYWIEAVDEAGRGALAPKPDPVAAIPYWVIRIDRQPPPR